MPLVVQPLAFDDIPKYNSLFHDAFFDTPIGSIVHRAPPSAASREAQIKKTAKQFHNPHTRFWKAVDADTGEIAAAAKWSFYTEDRAQAEVDEDTQVPAPGPESNEEGHMAFFGHIAQSQREFLGTKKHALLHVLMTHPRHRKRGAGSILLREGLAEADRLGLESYVAASEDGLPLYAKHGFEAVKAVTFDLAKYGSVEGTSTNTIMIRPARAKEGVESTVEAFVSSKTISEPMS
ncbi:acyl-CoA N-acyltransferase [Lineolata rhizophorae]|uniref:Acyl-CoA N-acyltransferase n=1 Tax=Lineolata rhizophorae TaxID=578093 RepID=A0A6A6NSP9_9PEZI|nr:acyl-CoA N-acyltransferase [Lineolata rhizophorae]